MQCNNKSHHHRLNYVTTLKIICRTPLSVLSLDFLILGFSQLLTTTTHRPRTWIMFVPANASNRHLYSCAVRKIISHNALMNVWDIGAYPKGALILSSQSIIPIITYCHLFSQKKWNKNALFVKISNIAG